MAYEKPALYAEYVMPDDKNAAWIVEFTGVLGEIPEVHWRVNLSQKKIKIIVSYDTDYLSHRSPRGTHEFCRGWIVRGIVGRIDALLGEELVWTEIDWLWDRWQIVKWLDVAPRELRKVDLQSGEPVKSQAPA